MEMNLMYVTTVKVWTTCNKCNHVILSLGFSHINISVFTLWSRSLWTSVLSRDRGSQKHSAGERSAGIVFSRCMWQARTHIISVAYTGILQINDLEQELQRVSFLYDCEHDDDTVYCWLVHWRIIIILQQHGVNELTRRVERLEIKFAVSFDLSWH